VKTAEPKTFRRARSLEELRRDERVRQEQVAPQHAHRRLRDLIHHLDSEDSTCLEH
jgi:hypothetical protein